MEVVWISAAFVSGLLARQLGLPPMVGYLAAGFALNALGHQGGEALDHVAHLGVLLLLFAVGLKLRLATLARPEVLIGGLAHLSLAAAGLTGLMIVVWGMSPEMGALLGVALGFSSTVVAVKALEEKGEVKSFHGRVAIGILILQDIVAVGVMTLVGDAALSPWALVWLALPLARGLLGRGLKLAGHGELLLLYGLVLALGFGGLGFASVGLSEELGALVLGTLVAGHPRAAELGRGLWGLREVMLVGFFLNIGMAGLPSAETIGMAAVLLLALPLKTVLYFVVLLRFRLRARSALLATLALASYSEFGLIVAGTAARNGHLDERWLVAIALAVAISFAIAAPLNTVAHELYARFESRLIGWQSARRHADDLPLSLGAADVIVMGLGRVGSGAYARLSGLACIPIGLDSDPLKVARHEQAGWRVLYADAEDPDIWPRLDLGRVRAVLLALPDMNSKLMSARALRRSGFRGWIAATNSFPDEVAPLREAGVDATFNHYETAGDSFARRTWEQIAEADDESSGD